MQSWAKRWTPPAGRKQRTDVPKTVPKNVPKTRTAQTQEAQLGQCFSGAKAFPKTFVMYYDA